uniref:Uncharacterized protein LOC116957307 n=1 Tax=Petromyzon marinus TaxID=7757 RepID=A0AAJ7UFD4_PETMA|nr:uncharacterized protein LOC116957307 [Petromyzon marinus]
MPLKVFFWTPNIVGYVRLLLLALAWWRLDSPHLFVALYSTFSALDWIDGWLARRLRQTSEFGAWLDLAIDNLGRGLLWSHLWQGCGYLLSALEWTVFVCNHRSLGADWKENFDGAPRWVQAVMANGGWFCTPVGLLAVMGLDALLLWLYVSQNREPLGLAPFTLLTAGTALLMSGRAMCLGVEVRDVIYGRPRRSAEPESGPSTNVVGTQEADGR